MALTKVRSEQLDAAQTSITSVGTLTSLTMTGDLTVDYAATGDGNGMQILMVMLY